MDAQADRTEVETYTLGADLYSGCDPNVGSACFALTGEESTVRVTVADDSGLAVGTYYELRDASRVVLADGIFCASGGPFPIPPDASELVVVVDGPVVSLVAPVCPVPTAATTGTITAEFR